MGHSRDLVYDVGLHKGEDTDFYLRCGYRVVAFEANPDLVAHCRQRFAREIADGRLHIVAGAITADPTQPKVAFFVNARLSVWGTTSQDWAERNRRRGAPSTRIEVDRVDFAEVLRTYGMPAYLKIDIEGADDVVLGALLEFADRPRYVSLETDIDSRAAVGQTIDLLARLGYSRFKPVQQESIPGSRLRARSLDGSLFEYTFEDGASGPFGEYLAEGWVGPGECAAAYDEIFDRYRRIGHHSPLAKYRITRKPMEIALRLSGIPSAGWHDLHAELAPRG